jgi:hypothetical protein
VSRAPRSPLELLHHSGYAGSFGPEAKHTNVVIARTINKKFSNGFTNPAAKFEAMAAASTDQRDLHRAGRV